MACASHYDADVLAVSNVLQDVRGVVHELVGQGRRDRADDEALGDGEQRHPLGGEREGNGELVDEEPLEGDARYLDDLVPHQLEVRDQRCHPGWSTHV